MLCYFIEDLFYFFFCSSFVRLSKKIHEIISTNYLRKGSTCPFPVHGLHIFVLIRCIVDFKTVAKDQRELRAKNRYLSSRMFFFSSHFIRFALLRYIINWHCVYKNQGLQDWLVKRTRVVNKTVVFDGGKKFILNTVNQSSVGS